MSSTEDDGIVTVVDMNWVASLEKRASGTKYMDNEREPTIYRVSDILKEVDSQAYEPLLVSIGPYHHDKPHLQAMKQHKWKYLKFVLEQTSGVALVDYVNQIKRLETRARDAYSEEVKMSSNSFVEMMLLDGCFVMLTIMEWSTGTTKILEENTLGTRVEVLRDIFKLENQLPFFLLETLYKSAFPHDDPFRNLIFDLIHKFTSNKRKEYPSSDETFHHIVHLFHSWIDPARDYGNDNLFSGLLASLIRYFKLDKLCPSLRTVPDNKSENLHEDKPEDFQVDDLNFPWIPSATVLNEAGIYFELKKRPKSFLDITFHNGKLQIPQLKIGDSTNSVLRNLIAYEQCSMATKFPVSSYAKLMDYIINTAEDVELLQKDEIIINCLGNNQKAAALFNQLPKNVVALWNNAHFFGAINAMLKKRNTRYSKWRAMLNRKYFSNPWAAISLFGALLLFALTVTQTIYAIMSYDREISVLT